MGANTFQFFQPAYLPLLENQFQVNTFIQATQPDGLQLLHRRRQALAGKMFKAHS